MIQAPGSYHRPTVLFLDQAPDTIPHGKVKAAWSTRQPTGWSARPHTNAELLIQLNPIHSHDSTAPDVSPIPIHKRYSGPRQYFKWISLELVDRGLWTGCQHTWFACTYHLLANVKITFDSSGKGHGLQITPLAGGHMIGGTIWKIVKDGEEEIVYAIDFNHKKERYYTVNPCKSIQNLILYAGICWSKEVNQR